VVQARLRATPRVGFALSGDADRQRPIVNRRPRFAAVPYGFAEDATSTRPTMTTHI